MSERHLRCGKAVAMKKAGMYLWCLHLLAEIERRQEDFDAAVGHCRQAAEIAKERFGAEHPRYATALEKLGLIEEAADHLEEAEEAFTTTAEIRKEMLDEDNPLYLGTLEALARVFVKQEAYEKAIELYQEKRFEF